ncbi:hypothetical protein ACFQ1I_41185 [Kitasatospora arboriphila]
MRLYRVRPGGRWLHPAVQRLGTGMSLAVALTVSGFLTPVLGWVGELNAGWYTFGAYALLCTLVGAVSRPAAAPLTGLSGWLFFNGFAVHRYAVLGWASRTDLLRLGVFTVAALLAALPGAMPRRRIRLEVVQLADHRADDRC